MAANRIWTFAGLLLGAGGLLAGCGPKAPPPLTDLPPHVLEPGRYRDPLRISAPPTAARDADETARQWEPNAHRPWRHIVIHHSASKGGNAAIFDRWHRERRGWDSLGYHFVITNGVDGPDGNVQVGGRWPIQKWGAHCGGTPGNEYNNYGIGICLVGDFTDRLPSGAQLASLRRLVLYLMRRYDIPAARVIGHRDAPNARTACPGKAFHRHLNEKLRPQLKPLSKRLTD